jgi:hypothetical protein
MVLDNSIAAPLVKVERIFMQIKKSRQRIAPVAPLPSNA